MNEEVIGYMCSIAFDLEIDAAFSGTKIYPSEIALKAAHPCATECGITKVYVTSDSKVARMQEIIDDRNDKLETLDTEGVSELTGILYQRDFKIEELEAKIKTLKEFIEIIMN